MTDDPSSRENFLPPHPEAAGLSKRDAALARVDEFLSDGRIHRPQSKDLPISEEIVQPINIDEVAEAVPLKPPPTRRERSQPGARPEKRERKAVSALHWFFQTLLLLFVLVWVFLLGIFIGRGYLMDSPYGRQFIAWVETFIEPKGQTPEVSIAETSPPEAEPAPGAEETIPAATPAEPPRKSATEAEPTLLETVLARTQTIAPEDNSPETPPSSTTVVAAEPDSTPPPPPAPVLAPPSSRGYAVQTTYALNEKAAQALIERLKRQGFPAYFYKNSRDQYLVRVGRFKSIDEATAARDKLAEIGYKEPYISKLEPGER